jgi:heat-inducible transcriptional repressor
MADLNPRQLKILKTIVEEHIQTGAPVGSETLDKKYNLGVSPATIRNEMAFLTEQGFLAQPHTSAGRIPSNKALKFYIKQLMEEKQLSVADEVAAKEKVWDSRHELGKVLSQATQMLAKKTSSLAVTTTDKGDVYHAGYANILDLPEFFDIEVTKAMLSVIEDISALQQIFNRNVPDEPIHVLLGEEFGLEFLSPCGLVFTNFESPKVRGSIGVFGPSRLNYPWVIPNVRYFGSLINEILKNW